MDSDGWQVRSIRFVGAELAVAEARAWSEGTSVNELCGDWVGSYGQDWVRDLMWPEGHEGDVPAMSREDAEALAEATLESHRKRKARAAARRAERRDARTAAAQAG